MSFGNAKIGRMAIQSGAIFILLMASVGVAMYFVARQQLVAEVDRSLDRERGRILSGLTWDTRVNDEIKERILSREASRVISDKGHALFNKQGRQDFGRISLELPNARYSDVLFRDGKSPKVREARALAIELPNRSHLVIISHSEIVTDLNDVLLPLSLALFAAAILGGLLMTYLLGRQIAARLQQTILAADAISEGNITNRVPTDRLDGIFRVQAQSFNRMLDRMAGLINSQRQFSSNLAHDLRTPLTRLRGILREGESEKLPARVSRIFERAERESASTIRIFDALLRLSEIEAGQHPAALKPTNLRAITEDVIETMEPVLADAGCELQAGDFADVTIPVDADLIVQLLVNTLENVALHTPPGTVARVDVIRFGTDAIIRICDNGPGLPNDQIQRVLHPFERGEAGCAVKGTGLGLTIAQAIAHFHGGDLTLSNGAPGLTVEIRLPAV
jgi:signal transduction histidine kinase